MRRRDFVAMAGAAAGILLAGDLAHTGPSPFPPRSDSLFSLGVASGDPGPTSVVLWTRLARDPLRGGGLDPEPLTVAWELALDDAMRQVVRRGTVRAVPESAHAVHVETRGLVPDRWYWYRFRVGEDESPVGRTRTMPAGDDLPDRLRLAFVSCQNYEAGFYSALTHLAREDLDLVLHLGDYIYEGRPGRDAVRHHTGGEAVTLEDYRNRHALYRLDPALQAVHAAFPMIATWDDHEVLDNYAGSTERGGRLVPGFRARRAAAYRAYYEHLPLGPWSAPRAPEMRLYRKVRFGRLAELSVLDTRQYRSSQPCGGGAAPQCPRALSPEATLTGRDQERWLLDGLRSSPARWNVIAQQVMMAQVNFGPGLGLPEGRFNMDAWDGYVAARDRILGFLARARTVNPIVLSGDMHSSWVNDLRADFADPRSPVVATELVGTSVTSTFPWAYRLVAEAALPANPHVRYLDGSHHGYVRCDVTRGLWRADFRVVDSVREPTSPIRTAASFVVADGQPGAQRA